MIQLPTKAPSAWVRLALIVLTLTGVVSLFRPQVAEAGDEKELQIYFIDVEGGQSTLLITPNHHGFLIDTGWAGQGSGFQPSDPHQARDANRIVAAMHDAGIDQIDTLLITHFHPDHDGGVLELSQLVPIRSFVDHETVSPDAERTAADIRDSFATYLKVRGRAPHLNPHPGDRLPLKDLDVVVVSSAADTLSKPMMQGGRSNAACSGQATPALDAYENPRSTGVVVRFGKFRFLDVGDLSGQPLYDLVCPKDLVGPVDVYLVAHHGAKDVADPAIWAAWKPRVAVMNNGLKKGGSRVTYEALHQVSSLDVWQLHTSADAGNANSPEPLITNLDETTAYWIKLVANRDGSFRVFNPRTGEWKNYPRRTQ